MSESSEHALGLEWVRFEPAQGFEIHPPLPVDGDAGPSVLHTGGCHCGAVPFEVNAPERLVIWNCNCSICLKKKNPHFIVPRADFRLLQGETSLTVYTFGTGVAKHPFCKICGVHSFYSPRSNPDGYAISPHCLDPGTVKGVEIRTYDGQNWEQAHGDTGIASHSKPKAGL